MKGFHLFLAAVLVSAGVAASCQEVVIFADNRSMVVQSHRADGSWTYFKVGSGELAVPTASVLRVVQEKTQSAPVQAAAPAFQSPPARPAPPAVSVPSPWRPEPPDRVRPPELPPQQDAAQDDEEDLGDEEADEEDPEDKEPEPPPPPNFPPGQPGSQLPPGKMPPQPVVPSIFQQPRQPVEVKH